MSPEMTSMERVLTALSHREPDRVPLFLLLSLHGAKELGLSISNARVYGKLGDTLVELSAALENVKTLKGLLPICMHCKKIRDDKGYWNQIDQYISRYSEATLSHGICGDCLEKFYPAFTPPAENR